MTAIPPDWLTPDWPAPASVRALCTTRAGGVSAAPWDSLNLGDHVGDDAAAVAANRRRLEQAIQARPVFLKQVHGVRVADIDALTPDGTEADACVTPERGVACTIMVADCLPVLFTTRDGVAVAGAHAGWRGLAGHGMAGHGAAGGSVSGGSPNGVLEASFERFSAVVLTQWSLFAINNIANTRLTHSSVAADTLAWLGPCIGPQAFEVGAEVRAAFVAHHAAAAAHFQPKGNGKYLANLAGLARQRLHRLGITNIHGNDGSAPWCTVSNASRFFSHRRDAGRLGSSGRLAACIWRV